MRRTLSVVVTAVLAVGLAVSGTASATPLPDHARVKDRAGDAPAQIDLVSGIYSVNRKVARFSVRLTDLTESTFLAFEIWPVLDGWDRLAVYRERGRTVGKVYFVDNTLESSPHPVPHLVSCPGLHVVWKQSTNTVSVVWPASCRRASTPSVQPFEFHVFSRIGGVRNSPGDSLPPRKLKF
jgi:hypothetical protein